MAVIAAAIALAVPSAWGQIGAIVLGGIAGMLLLRAETATSHAALPLSVSRATGAVMLTVFFVLLVGLPLLAAATNAQGVRLFEAFYRAGSLVFGGGHVVLPLLQASVVPTGWVTNDAFLAGYGAAQAVPGPLFTFAAYLGAVMGPQPNGWAGAAICLVAVFLPSFLLVIGALPFWEDLRKRTVIQAALRGVNAAVVGLLLGALYSPVWSAGITSAGDFALGCAAFLLLFMWQTPPWFVVALSAAGGAALALV
jgi:chromate transporter